MLDIKIIREDPSEIEQALRRRDERIDLSALVAADRERLTVLQEVETLKAEKNRLSKEVGRLRKAGESADEVIAGTKTVGVKIGELEERRGVLEDEIAQEVAALPNLPHPDVTPGGDVTQATVVRTWGERPKDPGENHVDIARRLGLIDLERAARLSGSQFALYRGWGARLEWALIRFMLDLHVDVNGYEMILPPFVANTETLTASGQLPKFADQVYRCADDDLYLVPTAEVPLTGLHRAEMLREEDLPLRYCAYTPCFRREAGAHGANERGLIRTHQFNKVEIYRFAPPEASYQHLDAIVVEVEDVLQRLGLHYRTIRLVAGDMAQQASMTYDIEVWIPGQDRYYEVSSVSNCEDYQARRASIRYRPTEGGKPRFVHTLNGSALATSRLFAAILESNVQADGNLLVPEVLRPHLGGAAVITPDGGRQ